MNRLLLAMITVMLSLGMSAPFCDAQPTPPPLTVRGDLLTIKGDTYVIRDISGLLRQLRVDKETKQERLIVPGEKIEVQVSSAGRALSIKPVH
ncbi:MAG TPA: hypothetical protein VF443_00805 [Nitrospira sp.]